MPPWRGPLYAAAPPAGPANLNRLARTASEAEAGQAARLGRRDHGRRAWLDAVHVPRRWSLRRCVERGSDARPALIGLRRPALVRPSLRNARHRARLGYPRRVTLDHDVSVPDRHRDRTPRIARDVAPLARTGARLEPERAVHPEGADRGHMRAAVLVDGGQPRRAGVRRVRSRCWPRSELSATAAQSTGGSPSALPRLMISIAGTYLPVLRGRPQAPAGEPAARRRIRARPVIGRTGFVMACGARRRGELRAGPPGVDDDVAGEAGAEGVMQAEADGTVIVRV